MFCALILTAEGLLKRDLNEHRNHVCIKYLLNASCLILTVFVRDANFRVRCQWMDRVVLTRPFSYRAQFYL